jgi:hypothetical protein
MAIAKRIARLRVVHLWLPVLLVIFSFAAAANTVSAHGAGGYYLLRGVPAGPYTIHVWTAPGLLRTGAVHVDTAVFDATGAPALLTLVRVTLTPMDGSAPPISVAAAPPLEAYPHTRDAAFWLETPGAYRLEIAVSDFSGASGDMAVDVNVQAIGWPAKAALAALGLLSAGCGVWLLVQTKSFWSRTAPDQDSNSETCDHS